MNGVAASTRIYYGGLYNSNLTASTLTSDNSNDEWRWPGTAHVLTDLLPISDLDPRDLKAREHDRPAWPGMLARHAALLKRREFIPLPIYAKKMPALHAAGRQNLGTRNYHRSQ